MLELPDSWTWDFWIADTGDEFHLFFLFASRALGEESLRHRRASIGHAVSTDLSTWTRLPDALVRQDAPALDDVATWTGSAVRGDDGLWYLFYTGMNDDPVPETQRVLAATSTDLTTWTRLDGVEVTADPRWYSTAASARDEPFRDPWVFRLGNEWHMLVTARGLSGVVTESGVIGHATSRDLRNWTVEPPLSEPGHGFGQLEVTQVIEYRGRHLLIFSCLRNELADWRREGESAGPGGSGGVWAAWGDSPIGPFELERARLLTDDSRYAGRAVKSRSGEWVFLAFENYVDGEFVGRLAEPMNLDRIVSASGL